MTDPTIYDVLDDIGHPYVLHSGVKEVLMLSFSPLAFGFISSTMDGEGHEHHHVEIEIETIGSV